MFLEYTVQSKAVGNRISFFVKIENLSRALRSCCAAQAAEHIQARTPRVPARTFAAASVHELTPNPSSTQLKLTKKQGMPALSFEIHESAVQVLHEVPIRIVQDPQETAPYLEPPVGAADGAIPVIFPAKEFRGLKNVVERMRSVADWMRLTTSKGCMRPPRPGRSPESMSRGAPDRRTRQLSMRLPPDRLASGHKPPIRSVGAGRSTVAAPRSCSCSCRNRSSSRLRRRIRGSACPSPRQMRMRVAVGAAAVAAGVQLPAAAASPTRGSPPQTASRRRRRRRWRSRSCSKCCRV